MNENEKGAKSVLAFVFGKPAIVKRLVDGRYMARVNSGAFDEELFETAASAWAWLLSVLPPDFPRDEIVILGFDRKECFLQ